MIILGGISAIIRNIKSIKDDLYGEDGLIEPKTFNIEESNQVEQPKDSLKIIMSQVIQPEPKDKDVKIDFDRVDSASENPWESLPDDEFDIIKAYLTQENFDDGYFTILKSSFNLDN